MRLWIKFLLLLLLLSFDPGPVTIRAIFIYYIYPKMKVKVKRWHCVAVWKWEIDDEVCGICRMPFESCCPGVKFPGDDCPPVWGQCGHALHMQCVMKWLESQQNARQECPMCRQVISYFESSHVSFPFLPTI